MSHEHEQGGGHNHDHEHGSAGYADTIAEMRREKDAFFRVGEGSPIPPEARPAFSGLAYFPVDEKLRVTARLVRDPEAPRVVLATSQGMPREMVRYATLEFEIDGAPQKLVAFKAMPQRGHGHHDTMLFVPFRDATSGKESYGAARYLDLEESTSDAQPVDFNLAYNPYCAYDAEHFVCPFPPRENWLAAPIRAGEKSYEQH
jgi:hypothetical protein